MRAKGIDISKYQGTFEPQGNIDFIIQRASYGLTKDEKFNALLPGVKQIERRGAYHYFSTELDPIAQAEFFYRAQAGQGFRWLAVDYEATNNVLDAEGELSLSLFCSHLAGKTTKPILLYTSPYTYRDNICIYNSWYLSPLWMAHYNEQDIETGEPEIFGADDWLFWQHTNKGNGAEYGVGSEFVDLNVFNGTVAELDAWLGIEEEDCCEELEEILLDLEQKVSAVASWWNMIKDTNSKAYANEEEIKELKLGAYAGIEANQEELKCLTIDLGILRAREMAHTNEASEAIARIDGELDSWEKSFELIQDRIDNITIQCNHVHPKFLVKLGLVKENK